MVNGRFGQQTIQAGRFGSQRPVTVTIQEQPQPLTFEQQEQREKQQETQAYLADQLSRLKNSERQLVEDRERLRRQGEAQDVARLGPELSAVRQAIKATKELQQDSKKFVIDRAEAEGFIRRTLRGEEARGKASLFQARFQERVRKGEFEKLTPRQIRRLEEQGVQTKPTIVTTTTFPAQEITGIRSIDTTKGPITVPAFETRPAQEIFKETFAVEKKKPLDLSTKRFITALVGKGTDISLRKDLRVTKEGVTFRDEPVTTVVSKTSQAIVSDISERALESKLGRKRFGITSADIEERGLTEKQIKADEERAKRIESLSTGTTAEGKFILSEKDFQSEQVKDAISEARQRRIGRLKGERLERKKTTTQKFADISLSVVAFPEKVISGGIKSLAFSAPEVPEQTLKTLRIDKGKLLFEDKKIGKITKEDREKVISGLTFFQPTLATVRLTGITAESGRTLFTDPTASFEKKQTALIEGTASGVILGKIGAFKIRKFTKEEIRLKPLSKIKSQVSTSVTDIATIKAEERLIGQVAKVKVRTFVPERRIFVTTRGELFTRKLLGPERLKEISIFQKRIKQVSLTESELKLALKGKVRKTKPQLIDEEIVGGIVKQTERGFDIDIKKGTPFAITKGAIKQPAFLITTKQIFGRKAPTVKIARLKGVTDKQTRKLSKIDVKKETFETQKAVEDFSRIEGLPKQFKRTFSEKVKLGKGTVETEDLLKITKTGGIKKIPAGRRRRLVDLTFFQKKALKIETGETTGLISEKFLTERIKGVDITFPRALRTKKLPKVVIEKVDGGLELKPRELIKEVRPRKTLPEIKGVVRIREFELPKTETTTTVGFGKLVTLKQPKLKLDVKPLTQKVVPAVRKPLPPATKKTPVTQFQKAKIGTKAFLGTRVLTQARTGLRTRQLPRTTIKESVITKQLPRVSTTQRFIQRPVTRQIPRTTVKQIPRTLTKPLTKQTTKQTTKQVTKQITKQTTKQVPRTTTITTPRTTTTITPTTFVPAGFGLKLKKRPTKRKKKPTRFRSDIALAEGFTARLLKLPPVKIPRGKIPQVIPKFQTIGIRRRPVILR